MTMGSALDPLSILIIGPSQNGKTTLINRLIKLSVNKIPFGEEGDGNFKCTTTCNFFDLEIPLTDYFLRDITTGAKYNVPNITEEDKILSGAWWRKQTFARYTVEPCDCRAPTVRVRLIDTPGLDDSEGRDFENMSDVLATLNQLAKSSTKWQTMIHAVVLVYNAESSFSYSFQSIIKDYQRCMPNLFGGLSVINTHFSVSVLSSKRQHLLRDKILGTGESARARVLKARAEDFRRIFGEGMAPTHFFIDNRPKDKLAYDELLSRNAIYDILSFWVSAKAMPISQMRLIKSDTMLAVDKQLQLYLQRALGMWNEQLKGLRREATDRDALRSTLLQRQEGLENTIQRVESDLERYDNDTEYSIRTYATQDDPGVLELFCKWAVRSRIRNTMTIQEPEYAEFNVDATNSTRAKWASKRYEPDTRTWTGVYEGAPGKVPNMVARSFTTNRVKYLDRISQLRAELGRAKGDLAEAQAMWDERMLRSAEAGSEPSTGNEAMDALVMQVEAASDLAQILGQATPPVDKAFGAASRIRYRKQPRDIGYEDLFALVREARPDLLNPLHAALLLSQR
jgi:GTPase SAR1 family protein